MDVTSQLEAIKRVATHLCNEEELRQKLQSGRPLRVKYGIDPTAPHVHLGHTVPLRLLRKFQEFGHKAVIIIGNATARIGDPSGRDKTRTSLSYDTIATNAQAYFQQIKNVIHMDKAEIAYNGGWFDLMPFQEVMKLMGQHTLQQILTRDDFSNRYQAGTPIFMHEMLYPIMQGYDSVMVDADVELGGTEQLFNMMVGRDIQKAAGQHPQVVITLPILRGLDGERRMGKSLGNYISVIEEPFDMYSKIMSIPDQLMHEWFVLLTENPSDAIEQTLKTEHPMAMKKILAKSITSQFHDPDKAERAANRWHIQFSKKELPEEITEVFLPLNHGMQVDETHRVRMTAVLREIGLAKSGNDARRLIEQGAVSYMDSQDKANIGFRVLEKEMVDFRIMPQDGMVFKVGRNIKKLRLV